MRPCSWQSPWPWVSPAAAAAATETASRPSSRPASRTKAASQNLAIGSETLPEATGGDGALTYAISPQLPPGLAFEPATRLLSGTPTSAQPPTRYTYTATDSDAANPDSASLTFTITVAEDLAPSFEQSSIPAKNYVRDLAIDNETLPVASGGDGGADLHPCPGPADRPDL